jgi:hypothetical protein
MRAVDVARENARANPGAALVPLLRGGTHGAVVDQAAEVVAGPGDR